MSQPPSTSLVRPLFFIAAVHIILPFALQAADNARWDSRFFLSSINGEVRAITRTENEAYVGGVFLSADNLSVSNIAKWNGTNWSALGNGVNGAVNTIAAHGSQVFVAGAFTAAGGITANRVAKWNGASWSDLGSGINTGQVNALAIDADGALYVGGSFTVAGGISALNIAKWDGANWSALGAGVTDVDVAYISALAVKGTQLFAGGYFSYAGGAPASSIAVWNGLAWSAIGGGVDDLNYPPQVSALAISGNDLYAGGAFTSAGTANANNIAKWNGTSWSALGSGLERYFGDLPVTALALSGTRLIVGGRFLSAGGNTANNLAIWDGASWSQLAGGATGRINALSASGTNILVGGSFTPANTPGVRALVQWNGAQWRTVSSGDAWGFSGEKVSAIARKATNIFVAGTFNSVGSISASNIAAWDGSNWTSLLDGLNGPCFTLCSSFRELFAAGQFSMAGGVAASNIAMWSGTQWSSLGAGLNGPVRALASDGSNLFAGGSFTTAGGTIASNIARWDGTNWSSLGPGLNGSVYALALSGSNLFAAGRFTSAGGIIASNVARWNGSQWFAVGGGVGGIVNPFVRIRPPPVSALAISAGNLFVGGDFAWAGAVNATNIARWDGTNWSPLGPGLLGSPAFAPPPAVATLGVDPGRDLYAGGSFNKSGNLDLAGVAIWNGTNWSSLGEGISGGYVQVVVCAGAQIHCGGDFRFAGGKPASDFTIWHLPLSLEINRAQNNVLVSWPWALGAQPQNAQPAASFAWRDITSSPQMYSNRVSIKNVASNNATFFRLKQY